MVTIFEQGKDLHILEHVLFAKYREDQTSDTETYYDLFFDSGFEHAVTSDELDELFYKDKLLIMAKTGDNPDDDVIIVKPTFYNSTSAFVYCISPGPEALVFVAVMNEDPEDSEDSEDPEDPQDSDEESGPK